MAQPFHKILVGTALVFMALPWRNANANSAEQLCDRSKPAVAKSLQAAEEFTQLMRKGRPQLESAITDPARQTRVRALFHLAKAASLNFLYIQNSSKPHLKWRSLIRNIQNTQLVVRPSDSTNGPITYGAHVLRGETEYTPDLVVVSGAAILADHSPNSLLFLLLHELGHTIDPSRYPVPVLVHNTSSSPFRSVVSCLRSSQSVAARIGDAECHQKTADKYLKNGKLELADRFNRSAEKLRENPDFTESGISAPCPAPQGNEAFADWFATEVARTLPNSSMDSLVGFFCANYLLEAERDELLKQTPSGKSILDSMRFASTHIDPKDRVEKIFYAEGSNYCPL